MSADGSAPPATREYRTALVALVGVGLSIVATLIVVRDLDLGRTAEILSLVQPAPLVAAVVLVALQATARALRWQALLPRRVDGQRVPLAGVAMAMLVGYLGNTVLPARLGELIRAALVAGREAIPVATALGSALLERVIDVFVLALFGLAAAMAIAAPGWVGASAGTAALIAAAALIAIAAAAAIAARRGAASDTGDTSDNRGGRGGSRVRAIPGSAAFTRLAGQLASGGRIADRRRTVAFAAVLTVVAWLIDTALIWCVARSIGLELTPGGAMLVSVVAVLSTAIPTAPGYIGTFELAAVAAVGLSGVTGEMALAFAILAHAIAVLPLSIAGALSLWLLGAPSLRGLAATARTQAPAGLL